MATVELPIAETIAPASTDEVTAVVRDCFESGTPIYPIGGGTSLDFGLPAKTDGVGLATEGLGRVVDYPARDMTITVEAGIRMQALGETLASEGQRFPIDVPDADRATLGGVIATNFNGPRRYGLGTVRDYVIGISAVDGRGTPFKGGGRVVKNVAGYDFCKLMTGSLGTLGVITQVTMKVKPVPELTAFVTCLPGDLAAADALLAAVSESQTTPVAIEYLSGPAWSDATGSADGCLAIGLEGTVPEVNWMIKRLRDELNRAGAAVISVVEGDAAAAWWQRLAAFPSASASPLVLKANVVPSSTTAIIQEMREVDPDCSVQAHAGNGIVMVRFSEFPADGLSRTLVGRLQGAAARHHGNVVVLSNPGGSEMTRRSVWGGTDAPFDLMKQIKTQFDPKNLLNPGRFVYQ